MDRLRIVVRAHGIRPENNRIADPIVNHHIASFNDFLFVELPPAGGAITAIDFLNETMIVLLVQGGTLWIKHLLATE